MKANSSALPAAPRAIANAIQSALDLAGDRVKRAKADVESITAELRSAEAEQRVLKTQLATAVDTLESAVQAHDQAVQTDAAARAVPAE